MTGRCVVDVLALLRFPQRFEFGDAAGACVTGTELFLMAPLSLLCYRAIILRRPYRDALVSFTSALQYVMPPPQRVGVAEVLQFTQPFRTPCCRLFGTIVFVGAEVLTNFHNVPVDWNLEFTFHHNFYFWFGFVFGNGVWAVITPLVFFLTVRRTYTEAAAVKQD